MRRIFLMQAAVLATGAALSLAGCGDSHPVPASGSDQSAPAAPAQAYAPSSGEFVPASADVFSKSAEPSGKCNLDAINGTAPGSKPLPHGQRALFAGWAASNDGKTVPQIIAIVLRGTRDFEVQTPAGAARPDVASANGEPGLANAGYAIRAGLSAVAPGNYTVELHYTAGGKAWRCESTHAVTVQ